MILSSLIGAIIFIFLYKRYIPVSGVSAVSSFVPNENTVVLDLRDYQTTSKEPIPGSVNIPYAYLKRYSKEIPKKDLMIIATDSIEKNLAIRFLLKKRFVVNSFIILNQKGSEEVWNLTNKQKIV